MPMWFWPPGAVPSDPCYQRADRQSDDACTSAGMRVCLLHVPPPGCMQLLQLYALVQLVKSWNSCCCMLQPQHKSTSIHVNQDPPQPGMAQPPGRCQESWGCRKCPPLVCISSNSEYQCGSGFRGLRSRTPAASEPAVKSEHGCRSGMHARAHLLNSLTYWQQLQLPCEAAAVSVAVCSSYMHQHVIHVGDSHRQLPALWRLLRGGPPDSLPPHGFRTCHSLVQHPIQHAKLVVASGGCARTTAAREPAP